MVFSKFGSLATLDFSWRICNFHHRVRKLWFFTTNVAFLEPQLLSFGGPVPLFTILAVLGRCLPGGFASPGAIALSHKSSMSSHRCRDREKMSSFLLCATDTHGRRLKIVAALGEFATWRMWVPRIPTWRAGAAFNKYGAGINFPFCTRHPLRGAAISQPEPL